jgi:glycosyltransferase involved in cell wall biosynthesis
MKKPLEVRRLKASTTITETSLIEVFERGLQMEIESEGNLYSEVCINAYEIEMILKTASNNSLEGLPAFLTPSENFEVKISLSQRLIELLPALVFIRSIKGLDFRVSVYINTIVTSLAPLEISLPYFLKKDEIVVNTRFAKKCLIETILVSPDLIKVHPPIPELCSTNFRPPSSPKKSRNDSTQISVFSRICVDKCIHDQIEAMSLLPPKWHLNIYGFDSASSFYKKFLVEMVSNLRLGNRVHLLPQLNTKSERQRALLESDIIINTSTSFEESMGKVIIEAFSWSKPVIANRWNGFIDLIPDQSLIPTYWDSHKWFHVKSKDIAEAITNLISMPQQEPFDFFQKFLEMRNNDNYNYTINKKNNTFDRENLPSTYNIAQWIAKPRTMFINHGSSLQEKHAETLTKCFAPGLAMGHPANIVNPSTCLHPKSLLIHCRNKNLNPLLLMNMWLANNPSSPFEEIARQLILELSSSKFFN